MRSSNSAAVRATLIGVAGIIACWLLATPRNAGPDEPSHSVASAALVRGQTDGVAVGVDYQADEFQVPAMVGEPNPGCFAFYPDIAAACEGTPPDDTSLTGRQTTSNGYPIWGHLLPGLASFVPSASLYAYLARLLNALLPVALLVGALMRCRRHTSAWLSTGLLVGLTPIAWFIMGIVSPSALAIAGGAALWAATLTDPRRNTDMLLAAAWAATLLPRRDGPVWATLIIAFACLATDRLPSDLWRRAGRAGQIVIGVSLPLTLLPTLMNGYDKLNTMLPMVLVVLPVGEFIVRRWRAAGLRPPRPIVVALGGLVLAVIAVAFANVLRPSGVDLDMTGRVVNLTGRHLRQLVGVLGWLDTPIPESALLLWWVVLGAMAMVALLTAPRLVAVAAGTLGAGIVMAWVLELGTGDTSGTYWQGRYTMPLIVGLPMILAMRAPQDEAAVRRARRTVHGAVWAVWNAAFYAAMRRWGSGVDGTVYPWKWTNWNAPLHPSIFLVLHALASGWLLLRIGATAHDAPAESTSGQLLQATD